MKNFPQAFIRNNHITGGVWSLDGWTKTEETRKYKYNTFLPVHSLVFGAVFFVWSHCCLCLPRASSAQSQHRKMNMLNGVKRFSAPTPKEISWQISLGLPDALSSPRVQEERKVVKIRSISPHPLKIQIYSVQMVIAHRFAVYFHVRPKALQRERTEKGKIQITFSMARSHRQKICLITFRLASAKGARKGDGENVFAIVNVAVENSIKFVYFHYVCCAFLLMADK